MENRQSYLHSEWTHFPAMTQKVFTLPEFDLFISELNKQKAVSSKTVVVGGRICDILPVPCDSEEQKQNLKTIRQQTTKNIEKRGVSEFIKGKREDSFRSTKEHTENKKQEGCLFIANNGRTLGLRIQVDQQKIVHLSEKLVLGDWVIAEVYTNDLKEIPSQQKIKRVHIKWLKLVSPNTLSVTEDSPSYELAHQWQLFIRYIQNVFDTLGFVQVETPSLVKCAGIESEIMPFEVEVLSLGKRQKQYLVTSPEFYLKRLLAQGWTRLYEIKTVYRNNEFTAHHRPEFKLLEWYRGLDSIETLKKDLQVLLDYFGQHWPYKILELKPLCEVTMAELFKKYVYFKLTPHTSKKDLQGLCKRLALKFMDREDFNTLFFRIFIEYIEPQLSGPVLVTQYPPSQAIWSRITNEGWADRFEFYWKGLEIANAFHELNDPNEHRQRFKDSGQKIDEDFIRAIDSGLPPSAGIALGLERLFMAITDKKNIAETRV